MYLFSYFRTESEALHLAVSEEGFSFEALNGNRAILEAGPQAGTMRDPFVIQGNDGRYHLLATDGWNGASILHAASDDLIAWSEPQTIPVMANFSGTRNCWAPEAFRGSDGRFRIIWSSTVGEDLPEGTRDHRIYACTTEDFETYSDSRLFFDPGYNVIDATVVPYGDAYLMAFKDERGENKSGTDYKAIRTAMALHPDGPFESISDLVTSSLVEGPTIYRKDGLWVMLYDHFMDHHYGASLSEDGRNWQLSEVDVSLPEGPRHGSIIEIEDSVASRLKDHYG